MTKQNKPDEQSDALTPGAIATKREWSATEAQTEAERRLAERIEAAGGYRKWVAMREAARIARGTEAEQIADIAAEKDSSAPPAMWAYWFAAEFRERNPGIDSATRTVAESEIMHTFEAYADTLPLHKRLSGLPWPKGEPLPLNWREGLYMTKAELRAWAKEHAPDLLGSALLAEPESAPAAEDAEPGTPAEQWEAARGDMPRKHELAKAAVKECQDNKAEAARLLKTTTGPLYRALNWKPQHCDDSSVASVAPMYAQLAEEPHKT